MAVDHYQHPEYLEPEHIVKQHIKSAVVLVLFFLCRQEYEHVVLELEEYEQVCCKYEQISKQHEPKNSEEVNTCFQQKSYRVVFRGMRTRIVFGENVQFEKNDDERQAESASKDHYSDIPYVL